MRGGTYQVAAGDDADHTGVGLDDGRAPDRVLEHGVDQVDHAIEVDEPLTSPAPGTPRPDVSTVVPRLAGPVTSIQHSFIVSEQGTATIWGRGADEQAQQIIDHVAHPQVRDELRDAGRHLGFPLRPPPD